MLETLEETGRRENTLIMLVSDNGASAEMVYIEDDYGEIENIINYANIRLVIYFYQRFITGNFCFLNIRKMLFQRDSILSFVLHS